MAVPHSRELCLKEAVGAYEHKVLKICGQIDSELRGRGIGHLTTSPFLAGVWDSIGEITDAVIECDKASASRQLSRIRETGKAAECSPFHTENANLLKTCVAVTIQKIPTLLKSAHRLMPVDYSKKSRGYAEREEHRIELEYQALESEFQKDIEAAIQAHRQLLSSPTISESPTVASGMSPMSGSQADATPSETEDWIHGVNDDPPHRFQYGPLTDSKTALGYAIRYANLDPVTTDRALRDYLREVATANESRIWLKRTGSKKLEAYFHNAKTFHDAQDRLKLFPQRKSGEANGSRRQSTEATSQ